MSLVHTAFKASLPVFFLALVSCAGGPSSSERDEVPQWIVSPPEDTSEEVYFVGAGSDSDGSVSRAEEKAIEALASSIVSFIGVEVTQESPPAAVDALNEFTASLKRSARREAGSSMAGFRIEEQYKEERGSLVNVYLLAAFRKEEILEHKSRLRALFSRQDTAVESLEEQGDLFFEDGFLYRSATAYIEAAAAAVGDELPEPVAAYERNIEKAKRAISDIELEALNDDLSGYVRQSFSRGFKARVFADSENRGKNAGGLGGVPLEVSYRVAAGNGRKRIERASVVTNDMGIAEYRRPAPRFVGFDTLSLSLDIEDILRPLLSFENMPKELPDRVNELRAQAARKRIVFSYSVSSRAKEIPTAGWVVGFDNGGKAPPPSDVSVGIMEILQGQDFSLRPVSLHPGGLGGATSEVTTEVNESLGESYERLIFGSAFISDFTEENGRYTVKVSGNVRAADLPSGLLLYDSGRVSKSANGQNPQSAISAAFKEFGRHVGKALAEQLP